MELEEVCEEREEGEDSEGLGNEGTWPVWNNLFLIGGGPPIFLRVIFFW